MSARISWPGFLALLVVSVSLWIYPQFVVAKVIEASLVRIAFPLRVGLAKVMGFSASTQDQLESSLLELEEQHIALHANYQRLQADNAKLIEQVSIASPEWRYQLAHVVSQETGVIYLDKGLADGIKAGQTVIRNGLVLGKVDQVQATGSRVMTVFDESSQITAQTASTSAMGVVRTIGTRLEFGQVLPTEQVIPGDAVLTTGADGWLPGLPLGEIEAVVSVQSDVFIKTRMRGIDELPTLAPVLVIVGRGNVVF